MPEEQQGFTLIELLMVISIISFISSIILVSMNSARKNARNVQRKANLAQLAKALESYANDNGSYPSTSGAWWGVTALYGSHALTGSNGYIPNLAPTYVGTLPQDPNTSVLVSGISSVCTSTDYPSYLYNSNGVDYKLLAHCLPENVITASTEAMVDHNRDGGPNVSSSDPVACNGTGDGTNIWAWAVYTPGARCW